jgi:RNA-splicing ligase RtcB
MFEIKGKYTAAIVYAEEIEETCISQITQMTNNIAFVNPIAIMPDCHTGKGSVIGFTMKMTDKIIPNIIGVDGSCGMLSVKIKLNKIDCKEIDNGIREYIPFGRNIYEKPILNVKEYFHYDELENLCKKVGLNLKYVECSLGTVGGGNHFIEFGRDSENYLWITIHSGSRNLGKRVCEYWQKVAKDKIFGSDRDYLQGKIDKIKEDFKGKEIEIKIKKLKESLYISQVQDDLAFLQGEDINKYLIDMNFIHRYAHINRKQIMKLILKLLFGNNYLNHIEEQIETVHNYISIFDKIIRKGAISSYIGEKIIIPLNMRDGILICKGKSNPDWNYSAPHGAGRILSRSAAKEKIALNKFKEDMKDIYSTSVCTSTLDEAPDAYKESILIEKLIEPTAIIINKIKPILNMKDKEENFKSWKELRKEKKLNKKEI